jgi:hypothetical protein
LRFALICATGATDLAILIGAIAGVGGARFGRRMVMLAALSRALLCLVNDALLWEASYSSFWKSSNLHWLDKLFMYATWAYYGVLEFVFPMLAIAILWKRKGQE